MHRNIIPLLTDERIFHVPSLHQMKDEPIKKKKKKKKSHGLKRKSRNPSPSSASSSLSVPRDPRNPLHAAYSLPLSQRYMKGRQRSLDEFSFKRRNLHCARKMRCDLIKECYTQCDSPPPNSLKHSERWNHDIFENRSESPVRERTKGAMWDTRQGAWRSRAGGVYLPPSPVSPNEENGGGKPRERPARYKHRNNINHTARYFTAGRRSRSPLFVPRERGSPVYE